MWRADSNSDPLLANWVKSEEPFLAHPPPDMGLVGWRDPFIFEFHGKDGREEWGMLLGSGIKGKGGSVMIYRSPDLRSGARPESFLPFIVHSWLVPMSWRHFLPCHD